MNESIRVAIIGGGPSGLAAAAALAPLVDGEVRVIEREQRTGGIPRHSDHPGYGIRDLRRFMSGPAYAQVWTQRAREAGAHLQTGAMVTGWAGDHTLEVTSPRGRQLIDADAIVLATGARERPRPARRIPGDRPSGVYTTGQLQNLVHLHHREVGSRAVVIGAELVSWSAVMTLREAGCQVVTMVSRYSTSESYAAFRLFGRHALRVPVARRCRVVSITGRPRVTCVEVEDLDTGQRHSIACDTVVTTGDWIPDHELVRSGGLILDAGTLGPRVDTTLATSRPGVFAAGNLVHPVDTADVAALDGTHVARHVTRYLDRSRRDVSARPAATAVEQGPDPARVELRTDESLRWIAPQLVPPGGPAPARGRLLSWTDHHRAAARVVARQDGRVIATRRLAWPAAPGRVFRIPFSLVQGAKSQDGPVTIGLI